MTLSKLRVNPEHACQQFAYRTAPASGSFNTGNVGGPCTISCTEAAPGFFDLKATATNVSSDYFYPWVGSGVGEVTVPKAVPDGSVVMTGGMNGCTIVVVDRLQNYIFYHDADSKHLTPMRMTVAKVAPNDYDPLDWGLKEFKSAMDSADQEDLKGDISYGHFVVAVKHKGQFGMYVTGVISLNGLRRLTQVSYCLGTFG